MRVWVAAMALAAFNSSANAAELSGPLAPATAQEGSSAQAQVWFERALALDIGAAGAPNAVQAFAAMRRAANSGHTQAAFNVAAMLDSGRGAPRDVVQAAIWYARAAAGGNRRAAFNLGQLYESGEGVPANIDLSRAWYAAADLPAARERLAEARSSADRPALVQAPEPLFPSAKSRLRLACNKSISSGRRLSNPRLYASLSSSVSLALAIRARSGAGLSTLAACACHSRRALRIWLGASLRWREVRRAILCPAGRSLRSLRLRSPQRHSGRTALRSITRRYRFCPDRFAGQKTVSRSCDAHAAAVRNVRFTSTPAGRNAQKAVLG